MDPYTLMGLDDNTDDFMDENGRTIRYRRIIDPDPVSFKKGLCGAKGERIISDIEAEANLTQLNDDLHERLEIRSRAISNWKRLKIVIVILKMCNGRMDIDN
jgi:hypothetical protein